MYTAIPNRFRQEPLDLRGYDAWQDQEGLVDASDAVRKAWKAFGPTWQEARKADLTPRPEPDLKKTVHVPRELIRCGRAFGFVGVSGGTVTARERRVWWQFRARLLRLDPQVWWIFWGYAGSDDSVGMIAARHGVEPRYVLALAALCCRWWGELWRSC